jgi:predicted transcriptional regulator
MTELENIKLFFSNTVVKDCVSIKKVEEIAGLPVRSLYSFLRGEKYRYLTEKQIDKLIPVIVQIGYIPLKVYNKK